MAKKEVRKKASTEVAVMNFEDDAGVGVEFNQDDLAIPFIAILQKGSPQIDTDHPDHASWAHLEAKTGDYFNSVTHESAGKIHVVLCGYLACYVEWKQRGTGGGGGWVAQHSIDTALIGTCTRNDKNQDILPNGNQLILTHYHYVLASMFPGEPASPAVISMSSTQLKKSRRLNTLLSTMKMDGTNGPFTPPIFSQVWEFSSIAESNDKGNWRGFKIDLDGPVSDAGLYKSAKEFCELIKKGQVKVAVPVNDEASATNVDY